MKNLAVATEYQAAGPAPPVSDRPLVGQLLTHAATGAPLGPAGRRFAWRPEAGDQRQLRWVLEGGLGPLLHHATRQAAGHLPAAPRDLLLGADLTARIRHGNLVDAALEILGVCDALQLRATLLKGISVSEQLYPAEHLRPMSDIDVLLPPETHAQVEAALLDCGYRRLDFPLAEGMHHGVPLHHPRRDTLVELHWALFPARSPLCEGTAFGAPNVAAQSVESRYHGRPVRRLTPELQLAYIGASWFNDLIDCKVQPGFLASLFDAVYLLGAGARTLDWDGLLGWLDNPMAKASLYTMLSYLPRHGVEPVPAHRLAALAAGQSLVGPLQLKIIHAMLDRHLIGARAWDFALPPPVPGRYSLPYQFRKRLLGGHPRRGAR